MVFYRFLQVSLNENKLREPLATHLIYREIQILSKIMNEVSKGWIILLLLICATVIQSMDTTILVLTYSKKEREIVIMSYFGANAVLATIGLVYFVTQMAMLHESSNKSFWMLKQNLSACSTKKEMKLEKRFYKSCWTIKQQFGCHNFVDRLTPLNSILAANNLTINMLLLN